MGSQYTTFGDAAIQPADQKIIVVGNYGSDFAVARYNTNGTPDTTFGAAKNGKELINLGADDQARAVILQPDGKILVGGSTMSDANPYTSMDFAVVRLNPNGTLDSTFGKGGVVTTDLTGNEDVLYDLGLETVSGVTRIVAAGQVLAFASMGPTYGMVRYNLDGSLDTSFEPPMASSSRPPPITSISRRLVARSRSSRTKRSWR